MTTPDGAEIKLRAEGYIPYLRIKSLYPADAPRRSTATAVPAPEADPLQQWREEIEGSFNQCGSEGPDANYLVESSDDAGPGRPSAHPAADRREISHQGRRKQSLMHQNLQEHRDLELRGGDRRWLRICTKRRRKLLAPNVNPFINDRLPSGCEWTGRRRIHATVGKGQRIDIADNWDVEGAHDREIGNVWSGMCFSNT